VRHIRTNDGQLSWKAYVSSSGMKSISCDFSYLDGYDSEANHVQMSEFQLRAVDVVVKRTICSVHLTRGMHAQLTPSCC